MEERSEGMARSEELIAAVQVSQISPEKTQPLPNRRGHLPCGVLAAPSPPVDYTPCFPRSLLTPYVQTKEHRENYSRPPPDLIDNREQYEVETIRSHQRHGKKRQLQYLIKWKGYPKSDNTWEPVDHVQASQLVKEYE